MALRWGYLGAGGIAKIIAADFGHAGLKIQAVATRDMERTNAFADQFNIPNRHPDYASLVADPEVDVIYISTVQTLHRDHALFIAFAPAEKPDIAVAVIAENGGHGGSTAGPIAQKVMDFYLLGREPLPEKGPS